MEYVSIEGIPSSGPGVLIRRVAPNADERYVCISPGVQEQWIHWLGHRSGKCTRKHGPCESCLNGKPRKWRGFVHVWIVGTGKQVVLELTPSAATQLLTTANSDDLTGARLYCKRGAGRTARYTVTVEGWVSRERIKVRPLDCLAVLDAVWNVGQQKQLDFDGDIPLSQAGEEF